MYGIDRLLTNSLLESIKKEVGSKNEDVAAGSLAVRVCKTDVPPDGGDLTDGAPFKFEDDLKDVEDEMLCDFITVEKQRERTWLVIKNRHLTESILKTFSDEDKKTILDMTREKAESMPRILIRCGIPNTSAYRKISQMINDGFVVPTGMAETFEGKRAILYKSVIEQIQINIDKNEVITKILVPHEMLMSSTIVQAVFRINQRADRTVVN